MRALIALASPAHIIELYPPTFMGGKARFEYSRTDSKRLLQLWIPVYPTLIDSPLLELDPTINVNSDSVLHLFER